jgi:putative sigma-54 modulation protein
MKLNIHGKNLTITDAMFERTSKKLSFLDKYFNIEPDTVANVVVKAYQNGIKFEVTIFTKVGVLRAEVPHEDYYAAVDLALDKLEDQIRRQKTRLSRKHKEKLSKVFLELIESEENQPSDEKAILVRTKSIDAQEMDVQEAIMKMEMLNHSFFVYTDSETKTVSVVYKRLDGGYGCLETEPAAS